MVKAKKDNAVDNSYKQLTGYINQISNGIVDWPMITATIKRYTKDGMTYSGIKYALWYQTAIKGIPYEGLGLVPYLYSEAKQYWKDMQRVKQNIADAKFGMRCVTVEKQERDEREDIFDD